MQMIALCQTCKEKLSESYRFTPAPGRGEKSCSLCSQSGTVWEFTPINQPRYRRPALRFQVDREKDNRRRQWA